MIFFEIESLDETKSVSQIKFRPLMLRFVLS